MATPEFMGNRAKVPDYLMKKVATAQECAKLGLA